MKRDIAEQWAQALESGKYRQTQGVLRHGSAMCCLGVLCDLRDPSRWRVEIYEGADIYPPNNVKEWAGLRQAGQLVGLNDGIDTHKHTFTEIAAYIREHAEEL